MSWYKTLDEDLINLQYFTSIKQVGSKIIGIMGNDKEVVLEEFDTAEEAMVGIEFMANEMLNKLEVINLAMVSPDKKLLYGYGGNGSLPIH